MVQKTSNYHAPVTAHFCLHFLYSSDVHKALFWCKTSYESLHSRVNSSRF